jgi:hypothetical protein
MAGKNCEVCGEFVDFDNVNTNCDVCRSSILGCDGCIQTCDSCCFVACTKCVNEKTSHKLSQCVECEGYYCGGCASRWRVDFALTSTCLMCDFGDR